MSNAMQALANIRVVDLTHVIAGPFCTAQLAVMGADVIKIESPAVPDMVRATEDAFPWGEAGLSSWFTAQNAAKRSVPIDLQQEAGREIIHRLLASADVLVENYRAGAMAKLGLDYERVKMIKPDIIYCSMTGFGQDGPKREHTAYDNVIQAFSGLMAATGDSTSAPTKVGPPVLDYGTGIQAAFAIACALLQRQTTGEGQYIDVAMLDAALMLMASNLTCYQQTGALPPLTGNNSAYNAGYCCYDAADGKLMLGAFTGNQVAAMWRVLGDAEYGEQFRQRQPPAMKTNVEADRARIATIIRTASADTWEQRFNEHKVPAARVRSLDETLREAQLQYRTILQQPSDTNNVRTYPTAAFQYRHNGPNLKSSPPQFAQHTREVLTELGYSTVAIDALAEQGVIAVAGRGQITEGRGQRVEGRG